MLLAALQSVRIGASYVPHQLGTKEGRRHSHLLKRSGVGSPQV